MKRLLVSLFVIFPLLTGCVTGTRHLDNIAVPETVSSTKASGDIYISTINDARIFEQKPRDPSIPSVDGKLASTPKETLSTFIGRQRNGYGGAMGQVALPKGQTVDDIVRKLLAKGLESRGYRVVADNNAPQQLAVDVNELWAWFSPGFASVSFEAKITTQLQFSGVKTDNLEVKSYGLNKGQIASNANWELAFSKAFEEYLTNFDRELSQKGL